MPIWTLAAILVLMLAAGAGPCLRLAAIARGELQPGTAEGRRRARRLARTSVAIILCALPLAATLWLIGSPGDAWWLAPPAVILAAAIVAVAIVARRRRRAADGA
ncbi:MULTISPECIES: hypothetical protein [unclassified Agrococcus]|uniref:hypothetical protein n=1 Tax=unclassified Agrococcus TaxID=2615065 RepID=UPI00360F2E83